MEEAEIREKISNEISEILIFAMENCAFFGREAYGDYIEKMTEMIKRKIRNKGKEIL